MLLFTKKESQLGKVICNQTCIFGARCAGWTPTQADLRAQSVGEAVWLPAGGAG